MGSKSFLKTPKLAKKLWKGGSEIFSDNGGNGRKTNLKGYCRTNGRKMINDMKIPLNGYNGSNMFRKVHGHKIYGNVLNNSRNNDENIIGLALKYSIYFLSI